VARALQALYSRTDYTAVVGAGDETQTASEHAAEPSPPDQELAPATRIGRYEIERRLGAGGMGVVYAAYDLHLRRSVALKLVGPRIEQTSGQDLLVREAQAMAKLRHPNLATVHDIGVSGDRLFVVMELVDGGTLADWLAARPRPWREIVTIYLQAARGLAAAHAAGFVHRDFKPENVLVGLDSVARVSDFGVAQLVVEPESAATPVGTAGYIAPEILRHEHVDHRADQFSLCVALYTSLHGVRPFEPRDAPDRIAETLGELRLGSRGRVPRWLQAIIVRGLATDPELRWPTMTALVTAIERHRARRTRARVLIAAGALAAAAIGIAVATAGRSEPPAPPDWSPVVIAREPSWTNMTVSRDGSTLATWSVEAAWVEPRAGTGARRRVTFPAGKLRRCRLSHRGDQLACMLDVGSADYQIWAVDVATDRAVRRVPSSAAPDVQPGLWFDLGPDGSIAFSARGLKVVWRADAQGALAKLLAAEPGHTLAAPVWSPDGTRIAVRERSPEGGRIEVADVATGTSTVVSRRFCKDLEWLTDRSLACAPTAFRRPVVIELVLAARGHDAIERVRYYGPEYQMLTGLAASSAGVILSTSPNDAHLALLALDGSKALHPLASRGITDLPATGWTASGALVFGANVRGRLQVMTRRPDGAIESLHAATAAEVPLAVLGDTILFGRFPGGETTIPFFEAPLGRRYPHGELFRRDPDGSQRALGPTHEFHALLCAAARGTCLLAERSGGDVIAIDWNPATGARGRERARWSMSSFPGTTALSPDGTTLVQVQRFQGEGVLSRLDLGTGARRPVPLGSWRSIDSPSWRADGTLFALADASDGEPAIVEVHDGGDVTRVAGVPDAVDDEDFRVSGDGKTAAVLTVQYAQTHWWVALPPD
jgi:protein kinase-like protein